MGKNVMWTDGTYPIAFDCDNTLFITNHECITNHYWPWESTPIISKLPINENSFYMVHGLNDNPTVKDMFKDHKKRLSWNVYHDYSDRLGMPSGDYPRPPVGVPLSEGVWLDTDIPFYPEARHINFRWATDLTPTEIELQKPDCILGQHSNIINWVGTVWRVNEVEIANFKDECEKDHKIFRHIGAGQNGVVSIQDNIDLVRQSFMAPAISGSHHLTEGYAPCRIFKNISYGQYGITNSKRVNDIFNGKLIFHPDVRELYHIAKERLATMDRKELWALMDEVAKKHTYINRLTAVFKAIKELS